MGSAGTSIAGWRPSPAPPRRSLTATWRAAFKACDLAGIAVTVVEAFAPSAEDLGQTLSLDTDPAARIEGDEELLTQMLVNLVENALRHAGSGARIAVKVRATAGGGARL